MSTRRSGLGRGLGALLPPAPAAPSAPAAQVDLTGTEPAPASGATVDLTERAVTPQGAFFSEVLVTSIRPNPQQPRDEFDQSAHEELMTSLSEVGLLQPIVVRPVDDGFQLVMGERRWRACRELGWERIPAIVRPTEDSAMLRDALLENLHREQLNPLEEAAAYEQLLVEFDATHELLAERVGRSRSHITNTIRLLALPAGVQRRVAAGVLSAGHARALLGLADPADQERLAQRIVAEGLSVRGTEEAVAVMTRDRPVSRRRAAVPSAGWTDVASRLSDHFDTRVHVTMGRSKGRITVDFAGAEDLERILTAMAPEVARGGLIEDVSSTPTD
jgi:ParB family chromosome partitioning protein